MDRQTILARLRAHESELKSLGIDHLALFGSTARDEARSDSDVDLAALLHRTRGIDLFGYVAMRDRLAEMVGTSVDLVSSLRGSRGCRRRSTGIASLSSEREWRGQG